MRPRMRPAWAGSRGAPPYATARSLDLILSVTRSDRQLPSRGGTFANTLRRGCVGRGQDCNAGWVAGGGLACVCRAGESLAVESVMCGVES